MPHRHSARLRAGLAVAGLAMVLGVVGLGTKGRAVAVPSAAAATVPLELPDTVAFEVRYEGFGAEGVDLIWRGSAPGPVPAQVTIRMEYAGPAGGRGKPLWPVNVWLFYSADDLRGSFAAELSGSMDWRAGEMRVIGLVSDGARVGLPLEQRMRVRQPGLAGQVRVNFLPRIAVASDARPAR